MEVSVELPLSSVYETLRVSPGYYRGTYFRGESGSIILWSIMRNAPVVATRRTRWGWNSREGYEELDHPFLYVPGSWRPPYGSFIASTMSHAQWRVADNKSQLQHQGKEVNKNNKSMLCILRQNIEPCLALGYSYAFPVVLFCHVGACVPQPHEYPGNVVCLGRK